jgi:hypothetical protein
MLSFESDRISQATSLYDLTLALALENVVEAHIAAALMAGRV